MESIADLLAAYSPGEPNEIVAIKRYIVDEFGAESSVSIRGGALVITVTSAALANTLRLRLPTLQAIADTDKRLVLRIG